MLQDDLETYIVGRKEKGSCKEKYGAASASKKVINELFLSDITLH